MLSICHVQYNMELLDFTLETWLFIPPDAALEGLPAPSPAVAML